MTYTLIGTGRVAHFMARVLQRKGWVCKGIYGRDIEKAKALSVLCEDATVYKALAQIPDADYRLLAVSDGALETCSYALDPAHEGLIVHFSGSVSLDVLAKHIHRAVCWPVGSISIEGKLPRNIPAFCIASDKNSLEKAETLVRALGFKAFPGNEEQKKVLHLAAVFANNFTNHLLAICSRLCAENQVPAEILAPLAAQTVAVFQEGKSLAAQTGPAIRGDKDTQLAHLSMLQNHPEWQVLYRELNSSIEKLYERQ